MNSNNATLRIPAKNKKRCQFLWDSEYLHVVTVTLPFITVHTEGSEIETDDFAFRAVNDVDARFVDWVRVRVAGWSHNAFFGGQWLLAYCSEEKLSII